jgi:hypothetical protein
MIGTDWNSKPNRLILPKLFQPDCSHLNFVNLGSSGSTASEWLPLPALRSKDAACGAARLLPPRADIGPGGQSVGQLCLATDPPATGPTLANLGSCTCHRTLALPLRVNRRWCNQSALADFESGTRR